MYSPSNTTTRSRRVRVRIVSQSESSGHTRRLQQAIAAAAVVAALVAAMLLVHLKDWQGASDTKRLEARRYMAFIVCRTYVTPLLPSHSKADFAPYSPTRVQSLGENRFRGQSHVDCQTASTARVRTRFTCTLHYREGDGYALENLQMSGLTTASTMTPTSPAP